MRIANDRERETAAQTLKEVTEKLEEALRLAREQEEHKQEISGECNG